MHAKVPKNWLYDKAKLIEPTKTSEGRTVEFDGRKIPYFEYHKNKLVGDISFAQDKVKGYLETLERQRQEEPKEKAQEQGKKLAVKKIKTVERDKRTIKTGKASEQVVKNTGKGTIKIRITKEEGVT